MFDCEGVIVSFIKDGELMQFTSKNCILTEMSYREDNDFDISFMGEQVLKREPRLIDLDLHFKCDPNTFKMISDTNFKPHLKNKMVNECSIEELLFAARMKIKGK